MYLELYSAAEAAKQQNLQWPVFGAHNRYHTLNQKGTMNVEISYLGRKFIEEALSSDSQVLEIGCAFGLTCIEALERGACNYVANDMNVSHLQILARKISTEHPEKVRGARLLPGAFPEATSLLEDEVFDAILAENVLHFLTEQELKLAFKEFKRLLKPAGKIFLCVSTVFMGFIDKGFVATYQRRVDEFLDQYPIGSTSNDNFVLPGFVPHTRNIVDKTLYSEYDLDSISLTRGHLFLFEERIVAHLLAKATFTILEEKYQAVAENPWHLDGREKLIVIAKK